MSVDIEKILDEIQKGDVPVGEGDYCPIPYRCGLLQSLRLSDDGVTDCLGRNASASWFY